MAGPSSCFATVLADFCSLCGPQFLQLQYLSQRAAEPRSAPVFLFLLAGTSRRTLVAFAFWKAPQRLGAGWRCGIAGRVWFGSGLPVLSGSWRAES